MDRLIVCCGGTGGHFMPGLSVARKFREEGGTVLLLLGGKNASAQAGIAERYGILSVKFPACSPSGHPLKFLKFLYAYLRGRAICGRTLRISEADALLAMGSFASLAPVRAAHAAGIPVFLHDGNARIGRANLFLSRYAKALALSFPAVNAAAAKCPAILTGLPLRPEIVTGSMTKADAIAELNRRMGESLSPDRPTVLVFGGSLGAETINRKLIVDGDFPETREIQFIRLTGPGHLDSLRELYAKQNCKVVAMESSQEMHVLYSAADLVVSRAGGSSVSEIACYGKYALLLPYPYAADNHQEDNAGWLVSGGGAEILHDSECSPEKFTQWLIHWRRNLPEYIARGTASRKLASPDAPRKVLDMISNIASLNGTKGK